MTRPVEVVNVRWVAGNVDEALASDRRTFLKVVGAAVLSVQCLPWIAHASGSPSEVGKRSTDHLIIQSGPGLLDHVHDLWIPYSALEAPPLPGVELTSTQGLFHRHNVALTREELTRVSQGATITKQASSHVFVIAVAIHSGARAC